MPDNIDLSDLHGLAIQMSRHLQRSSLLTRWFWTDTQISGWAALAKKGALYGGAPPEVEVDDGPLLPKLART